MKKVYLLLAVLVASVQYGNAQCTSANGGIIQASSTVYCGSPITLTVVNAQLQGNTQWVWYSGSCGGTQVGTGLSISISPTTEATYYVRGEGGCATSACRTPIVITAPTLGTITSVSTGVERCGLGTVTLTAETDQGTINWYRTANETIVRGTGTSFTAGAQNFGTNTYYAEVSNGGCVTSPRTAVTFNVKDMPGFSSSGSSAACPGGTATITAIPNVNSTFSGWYDAPTGGNLVSASGVFTTPPLTAPVTYYGVITHTNGCTDNATWTPNIRPVPVFSSSTPGERCGPGSVNLSATFTISGTSLAEYQWYDAPTGGNFLSTQQNFATQSISNTTTFYATAITIQGCSATRQPVVATVKTVPTITSTTPASRCGDGTVSLSAAGSVGTLQWFNAETGGTQIGTGTPFTTPNLTGTTPYFVQVTNNGCSSGRTSVMATVNPFPTVTGFSNARCDAGTVGLGATSNGTISWFAAPTGGSPLATGDNFVTPSIATTTIYYLQSTLNGCTTPTRSTVSAIVRTTPTVSSVTNDVRCGEGAITLSATSSAGGIRWYDAQSGGNQVGVDLSYTTSLAATTTYYASAIHQDCESGRTAVMATIKPLPTLNTTGSARCDAGTVTLTGMSNGTINWFVASTGGSSIGNGVSFTTPSISATTNYFAEAVLDGCLSPARIQTTAIVNNTPAQPTITQNNANIESPVLTSSASSGNQWFRNDLPISGAVNQTFTISDEGAYKVQVNNSGCLSPFSTLVNYVITGFEIADVDMLKLYPNPTADELVVSLSGFEADRLVNVAIVDLMGRALNQSTALGGEEVSITVGHYTTGQYLVLASQGNRKIVRSFIKSR